RREDRALYAMLSITDLGDCHPRPHVAADLQVCPSLCAIPDFIDTPSAPRIVSASMTRFGLLSAALVVAVGISVSISAQSGPARSEPAGKPYVPVTDEMLWKPSPSNWLSWRRTLDGWGYSPLDQIDRSNVSKLRMVWARGMATGTVEATPLVYDGVMYL